MLCDLLFGMGVGYNVIIMLLWRFLNKFWYMRDILFLNTLFCLGGISKVFFA